MPNMPEDKPLLVKHWDTERIMGALLTFGGFGAVYYFNYSPGINRRPTRAGNLVVDERRDVLARFGECWCRSLNFWQSRHRFFGDNK